MKKNLVIMLLILAVLGLFSLLGVFYNWNVDNQEKDLRVQFSSNIKVNKNAYDEMWKIIKQDANVTDKYAADFSERVLPVLVSGREPKGEFMRWISEANPEFSVSLYENLMNSIAAERRKFKLSQDRTIDIRNSYFQLIENKPQKWFVDKKFKETYIDDGGNLTYVNEEVQKIYSYSPVTSSRTEKVFEEGKDDDIDLFN